jgi:hypothetical protein
MHFGACLLIGNINTDLIKINISSLAPSHFCATSFSKYRKPFLAYLKDFDACTLNLNYVDPTN